MRNVYSLLTFGKYRAEIIQFFSQSNSFVACVTFDSKELKKKKLERFVKFVCVISPSAKR